jgi:hypothetical protein
LVDSFGRTSLAWVSMGLQAHRLDAKGPHAGQESSYCPRGVGQSVTECVVKALRDVKVTGSKPAGTKNPAMLRVGVAQAGCDPRVILTA